MEVNTQEKPPVEEKKYDPYKIQNDVVKKIYDQAFTEGIIYPDSLVKYMDKGINNNKVSPEELSARYEQVNKHHKNRGLHWEDKSEKTEKGTVSVLKDQTGKPQACVVERTNPKDQSIFYIPVQFKTITDDEGNIESRTVNPDFTSSSIDKIKEGLNKMEVKRSANQVAHNIGLSKEKVTEKEKPSFSPVESDIPF